MTLIPVASRYGHVGQEQLFSSPALSASDTFTYDAASRMLTAVSGGYSNTVTYTYDDAGRKATKAFTMGSQTYTTSLDYDDSGQLIEYTYPDGTVVGRSYTDRGQLYQLSYDSTTIDTRAYDNGGRMTSSSYNNGVSESRSYNNDNTLASISFTGANLDQSLNLSLVGDWDSFLENSITQNRTHGPTHELLSAGGQNLSHDTKGNMTLIPAVLRDGTISLTLKWDFENKMTTADVGSDSSIDVTYKWDALGRRVYRDDGTDEMVYVQVGQQTIGDYPYGNAASSPKYNYLCASYIDEPVMREEPGTSEKLYYHRNQQYSIVALTNSAAGIVERYAYSAYGEPVFATGAGVVLTESSKENRYTYTGREWDEQLGLNHFRARCYAPQIGRFTSIDVITYRGGINLFGFAYQNPLKYLDPTGHKPKPGDKVKNCDCDILPQHWYGCCGEDGSKFKIIYHRHEQCCSKLGKLYAKQRSNEQCCADAKAAGLDHGHEGAVICCSGREVSCVWLPETWILRHIKLCTSVPLDTKMSIMETLHAQEMNV